MLECSSAPYLTELEIRVENLPLKKLPHPPASLKATARAKLKRELKRPLKVLFM